MIPTKEVTVVVLSKSPELLELHLLSHELYTPADVSIYVVDTSDDDDMEVVKVVDHDWQGFDAELGGLGPRHVDLAETKEEDEPHGDRIAAPGDPTLEKDGKKLLRYGALCNLGAMAACMRDPSCHYIVFANDDTVVSPFWLETMLSDFEALSARGAEPVGILGARSNRVSGPQSVYDRTLLEYGVNGEAVFCYPRIVSFFCMVEAESFWKVGGFDEDLPAWNFADDVLSVRFLKAGHLNWVSRVFIFHAGSQTFAAGQPGESKPEDHYKADMNNGEKYVHEKYPEAVSVMSDVIAKWYPRRRVEMRDVPGVDYNPGDNE